MYKLILVVLTVLILHGCASVPKLNNDFSEGNYSAIVKDVEHKNLPLSKLSLRELYFLCPAYYETHNYRKFLKCSDFVLQHPNPGTNFYPGMDVTYVNKYEFKGYLLSYKAQMLLEFGEYQMALETATNAESLVQKGDKARTDFYLIDILEVKALSLIHLNRSNELPPIISELETIHSNLPTVASTLGDLKQTALAKIYFALHDYENARKTLETSTFDPFAFIFTSMIVFVDNVSMDKEIREAAIRMPKLYMLSKAYMETGDTEKAKKGFDALLQNPIINSMGGIHWLTLKDRAVLSWNSGHQDKAIDLLKQAVDVIESQRSTIQTEAYKIGFVGDKQQVYALLIDYLIQSKHASEAFAYAEKAKARALVDMLAQKQSFKGEDETTTKDLRQLSALDEQYQLQTVDAVKQSSTTRGLITKKYAQLQKRNPEVASLVSVSEVKTSALQNLLSPDELLVEFYGDKARLYAFVVSRESVKVTEIPAKGLGLKVSRFRSAILQTQNDEWKATSKAVYDAVIAPIQSELTQKKLVIVPHGALHYLPFAALYDGHRFLLDKFSIRILPSASVMQYLKTPQTKNKVPMLALGNPDLHNSQLDLPGAQSEVKTLGKMVVGSKVAIRGQATETLLKKYADQAAILHIASHGEFNAKDPLQSRLLLASDAKNDGSLKVSELYDLKLNSELVTLSACQTGLGDVESGDDVIGLTRGFLFAGAENIVASLWVVDDQATAQLMADFYRNLKKEDVEQSLREAQLTIKDKLHSHPFYWAAFQLTGAGNSRVYY